MLPVWVQNFDDRPEGERPPLGWESNIIGLAPLYAVTQIDSVSPPHSMRVRAASVWTQTFPEWTQATPKRLSLFLKRGPEATVILDDLIGGVALSEETGPDASFVTALALAKVLGDRQVKVWEDGAFVNPGDYPWTTGWNRADLYVDFETQELQWRLGLPSNMGPWVRTPLSEETTQINQISVFVPGSQVSILYDDFVMSQGPFMVPSRPWQIGRPPI